MTHPDWPGERLDREARRALLYAGLWIVPARVEGTWRSPQGELVLKQHCQGITGTLGAGALAAPVSYGRLNGDELRFTAGGADYRARVTGEVIEGSVARDGENRPWKAVR